MSQESRYPIGNSDFRNIRERQDIYVDKTWMIHELIGAGPDAVLLPRPRRFGKTLALSMLRYFFEKTEEDHTPLFEGLRIQQSKSAWQHFQQYLVIAITFKDVKATNWKSSFYQIGSVLTRLCEGHRYLLESDALSLEKKEKFRKILRQEASPEECGTLLLDLSQALFKYHQKKVVLLIDEYDTPIHGAYANGFYDEVVSFFRSLLSSALKDNAALFKGVITGILRIAKESLFSGLNNVVVYSLLRTEFATYFGFTELEVEQLVEPFDNPDLIKNIRQWYNGYIFGGVPIYNPWSIINFLGSEDKVFRPYWVQTSSNELLRQLLFENPLGIREEVERLLRGGCIEKPIEDNIVFRDLKIEKQAIWSFLLFTGYLKATRLYDHQYRTWAELCVPNQEVLRDFYNLTGVWTEHQLGGSLSEDLLNALLQGDALSIQNLLSDILQTSASYHDLGSKTPERFYHAFLLGVLVHYGNQYEIRSNREAGHGRYDLVIIPKDSGRPAVVLEIKVLRDELSPERALGQALEQIQTKNYATELRARKLSAIHGIGLVFSGKRAFAQGIRLDQVDETS